MLGIIGGVGPDATARLYQTLMRLSASEAEGALPRLLLYNLAMTPRIENAYLSGCINAASPERLDAPHLRAEPTTLYDTLMTRGVAMAEVLAVPPLGRC